MYITTHFRVILYYLTYINAKKYVKDVITKYYVDDYILLITLQKIL